MKPEEMFNTLDETMKVAETLTGLKRQFTDLGWSPDGAERMVYALMLVGSKSNA